jgi:hypothetical protein
MEREPVWEPLSKEEVLRKYEEFEPHQVFYLEPNQRLHLYRFRTRSLENPELMREHWSMDLLTDEGESLRLMGERSTLKYLHRLLEEGLVDSAVEDLLKS